MINQINMQVAEKIRSTKCNVDWCVWNYQMYDFIW